MECNFVTDREYVPKWNGNGKLPEAEQIKIFWHIPQYKEREKIKRWEYPKMDKHDLEIISKKGENAVKVQLVIDREMAVRLCVDRIDNLKNGKTLVIDGDMLADSRGMADLVEEIGREITTEMDSIVSNSKN